MAQKTITKNFCPQCGAENVGQQHFCPKCGTNNTSRQVDLAAHDKKAEPSHDEPAAVTPVRLFDHYADTTTAVRPQNPDATIRINRRDPNATVRVSRSLPSKLFKKAIEQSQLTLSQPLPLSTSATPSSTDALPSSEFSPLITFSSGEGMDRVRKQNNAEQFVALARKKQHSRKRVLLLVACVLCLIVIIALSAIALLNHNGEASAQHLAAQRKLQLDSQIQQARVLGVPVTYLQPVLTQEQQLANAQPPLPAVNPLAINYYAHAALQYLALQKQLPDIIATATAQLQAQAQRDMQDFQAAIARWNVQGMGNTAYFSQQFSQDQLALSSAQYPKDYRAISQNAQQSIAALLTMGIVYNQLNDFKMTISNMGKANLDVTALQAQYANDLQTFQYATSITDFQNLGSQIDVQYQQAVVVSIQAFPFVGITKLNELQQQISQLQSYGIVTSHYQQRLSADELAEQNVKTIYDALLFIKQIDNDISSMYGDLVKGQAHALVKQFHQEVNAWAQAHPYYDSYDHHVYALDDGYMGTGIGNTLDSDLTAAATPADYAAIVNEANNDLFNLHMFEADYADHTPYNSVHATDLNMLNHYNLQGQQVLMVSLAEQVMRVYQHGKLVQAFYVTTGRSELPSPPGVWSVLDRKAPATFVAGEPQSSPYWFPPTVIQYAILYHYGGDFVHDAWWRQSFGPGTQFPHEDAGGNTAYNFDGSHGCINLSTINATWVYNNTNWNTVIVVY